MDYVFSLLAKVTESLTQQAGMAWVKGVSLGLTAGNFHIKATSTKDKTSPFLSFVEKLCLSCRLEFLL